MKTEIAIWNGGGWNNFRNLKSLKVGTRGLAAKQGISKIEVAPRDCDRPLGIAARYYDAAGALIFTQGFDPTDSPAWIRDRVLALLVEGVQNRIDARRRAMNRDAFRVKISAWRRNFDAKEPVSNSIDKLSVKFHNMRHNAISKDFRPSRKLCTESARAVCAGQISYAEAAAKIIAAGGIQRP